MRNRLRDMVNRLREARYAAGGLRGLLLAPIWLIRRRYLVFEMRISSGPRGETPETSFTSEQLWDSNVRELLGAFPNLDYEQIMRRGREGQVCYVCRTDGRIIHYRWYASTPTWLPFLNATWYPEEGDYTVLGAFTHPAHRGLGINSALLQQGLARARELGLRRVVSFIACWNDPSLRTTRRAGLEQIGTVTLWKLGFMSWHSCSGSASVRNGKLRIARR